MIRAEFDKQQAPHKKTIKESSFSFASLIPAKYLPFATVQCETFGEWREVMNLSCAEYKEYVLYKCIRSAASLGEILSTKDGR